MENQTQANSLSVKQYSDGSIVTIRAIASAMTCLIGNLIIQIPQGDTESFVVKKEDTLEVIA